MIPVYYDSSANVWKKADSTNNGARLLTLEDKYVNRYPIGSSDSNLDNYAACSTRYGDAIYETSSDVGGTKDNSWGGDNSAFINGDKPFLARGGSAEDGVKAGLFSFNRIGDLNNDGEREDLGFRVAVVVE